jgi:hypothetical protein
MQGIKGMKEKGGTFMTNEPCKSRRLHPSSLLILLFLSPSSPLSLFIIFYWDEKYKQ